MTSRNLFSIRCIFVCVTICLFLSATNASADTQIDLYSVGPGNDIFSKFGHSALCVTNTTFPNGRCYDFGVTDASDPLSMVWGTIRKEPMFVAISVELDVLVKTFSEQERSIFKQTLPFDTAHADAFAAELESAVNDHARYAYNPAFDNCTTEIRDRLDVAFDGKLRAPGPPTPSSEITYRQIVEAPFSGRILELMVLALAVGTPADRAPTSYEAMFLPYDLRDAVEARLGSKPEQIYKRDRGIELRTSTAVGRGTIVMIGLFLSAFVWAGFRPRADREKRARRTVRIVGCVLGVVAIAVDLLVLLVTFYWVRSNWVLILFLPTDIALGWLSPKRRETYILIRLAVLASFGVLSLLHIVAQPLFAVALLAVFPLAAIYRAERKSAPNVERRV
ncbi:MAG: DUF4105 domain-containing protein, partial [Polyangiaceae bacterium]